MTDHRRAELRAAVNFVEKMHNDSALMNTDAEEKMPKFGKDGMQFLI